DRLVCPAMAAAVLQHQQQQQPAFSTLTLFESTLMNAGMLLDSMTLDDLCAALRLINNLHLQLVDIMQPSAADVQLRLVRAEHRLAEAAPLPLPVQQPSAQESEPQIPADRKRPLQHSAEEFRESKVRLADTNGEAGGGCGILVHQVNSADNFNEAADDEAALVDDSESAAHRTAGCPSILSCSGGEFSSSANNCWSGNVRNILQEAYKKLRGSGPHLFDFSKSWEHSVNQDAARSVLDLVRDESGIEADEDTWKKLYQYYLRESKRVQCNRRTAARCNRMKALGRRQKAFESLLPHLSPDELNQFRAVLSRDFTSSDEEDETASGSGEAEDEQANLRVRSLVWESAAVADIKRRLDDTFYARFATVKQRAQLARCQRFDGAESNRGPPPGAPDWAVRSDPTSSAF
ncbi:hypothetical protein BOX15_Mlig034464g4, partial [Macrostomum lignano]